MRVWEWLETIVLKSLGVRVVFEFFGKVRGCGFLIGCVFFFKARGGAAMALNEFGKFEGMRARKICGKFEGKGLGMRAWKVRGGVGVESSRKVRGGVGVESSRKVRG